jgi:hypothetical protein
MCTKLASASNPFWGVVRDECVQNLQAPGNPFWGGIIRDGFGGSAAVGETRRRHAIYLGIQGGQLTPARRHARPLVGQPRFRKLSLSFGRAYSIDEHGIGVAGRHGELLGGLIAFVGKVQALELLGALLGVALLAAFHIPDNELAVFAARDEQAAIR